MFTPKHLLVNCITLLSLERREGVNTSSSKELVNEVLSSLPIPEGTIDHDHGRQTFLELRQCVIWLNGREKENFPTDQEILQSVQIACKEQSWLFEAVMNPLLEQYDDINAVVKIIHNFRNTLYKYLNDEKIRSIVKDVSHRLMFKKEVVDPLDEVRDLAEKLEPYLNVRNQLAHPAMMGSMDFSDKDTLASYFNHVKTTMSDEGALKLGWKGFNRMLGSVGAFKRGEFVLIGALQHHFKSGLMMSLFVHILLFNKPQLRDKTRKPLIPFFSFENEISDNLLWIYKYIKENETGEAVIDSEVDAEEASAFVMDRLTASGFEVKMFRFDPTEFTAAGFVGILENLIGEGYEIVAVFIDYLNMLSKAGIDAKIAGDDIRLLFRRIRNFTAARGITCVTPHQLSSEAMQLTRDNVDDFVKNVANRGYYDGCKRLGQEPDLEIMIHKVEVNGESFLTVARGKHRSVVTELKDQYLVLPFKQIGTIPWDIDKDYEVTCAVPGGGAIGTEEEKPWWID